MIGHIESLGLDVRRGSNSYIGERPYKEEVVMKILPSYLPITLNSVLIFMGMD